MTPSLRKHFTLTAPSKALDRRIYAAKGDFADVALAGKIFVPHYAAPLVRSVIAPHAGIYQAPDKTKTMVSELLNGEQFAVLETVGVWAWGFCLHDHYVGYIEAKTLGALLPLPPSRRHTDYVQAALTYLDVPYVWGGRSHAGIDCSGLIQVSLAAAGIAAPRDSDQQRAVLGSELADDDALQKGDFIFFPGHVGMMIDDTNMVHATSYHMRVVIEALAAVIARKRQKDTMAYVEKRRLA